MDGLKLKGILEGLMFVVFGFSMVYSLVTGTPVEAWQQGLLAAVILGYFGYSALEHYRRKE